MSVIGMKSIRISIIISASVPILLSRDVGGLRGLTRKNSDVHGVIFRTKVLGDLFTTETHKKSPARAAVHKHGNARAPVKHFTAVGIATQAV